MVYFGVPTETSFGENSLLGWYFAQKRQAKDLDHLMHAIEVGREREPPILIHLSKAKRVRGKNKTRKFYLEMGSGVASTLWVEVMVGQPTG